MGTYFTFPHTICLLLCCELNPVYLWLIARIDRHKINHFDWILRSEGIAEEQWFEICLSSSTHVRHKKLKTWKNGILLHYQSVSSEFGYAVAMRKFWRKKRTESTKPDSRRGVDPRSFLEKCFCKTRKRSSTSPVNSAYNWPFIKLLWYSEPFLNQDLSSFSLAWSHTMLFPCMKIETMFRKLCTVIEWNFNFFRLVVVYLMKYIIFNFHCKRTRNKI